MRKILSMLFAVVMVSSLAVFAACEVVDSSEVEKYTVTWQNYDGTVLETDADVEKGSMPTYDGETPVKAGDAQYAYTFKGWDKELTAVTEDVTYTAEFTQTVNKYTVTWMNGETVLKTAEVEYGTTPAYDGETPVKAADAQYTYTFKGWDKELTAVTEDVTYTAEFTQTVNKYTVTWKNGETVLKTAEVEYGTTPAYDGETPVKAADAQYTYTFKGWDKEHTAVTEDVTYTAEFTQTVNKYTLVWKDYNGEVVRTDSDVEYGSEITAPENSETAGYTFSWGEVPATVTGNATFTETRTINTYKLTVKYFDTDENAEYQTAVEVEFNVENKAEKLTEVTAMLPESGDQYVYVWKDGVLTELTLENVTVQINRTTKEYSVTYYDGETVLETKTVKYGSAATYTYTPEDVDYVDGYKKAFVNLNWVDANGDTLSLEAITANVNAYAEFDEIVYSSYTNSGNADLRVLFKAQNKFASADNGTMTVYLRANNGSSFAFVPAYTWVSGEKQAAQWISYTNQWYKVEIDFNAKTVQFYNPNGSKGSAVAEFVTTFDDLSFVYRKGLTTDIGVMNPDVVKVTYMEGETELSTEYMLKGQSATKTFASSRSGDSVKVFDRFEDVNGNAVTLTNVTADTTVQVVYNAYTARKIKLSTYSDDAGLFTFTEDTTDLADSSICSATQVIVSTQTANKWILTDINFGEYDYCFLYMKVSQTWKNIPKLGNDLGDLTGNIISTDWVKIEFIKNDDGTYNVVCSNGEPKTNVVAGKANIFVFNNGGTSFDHTISISELFYANK